MAYRLMDGEKLGPHVAGEPDEKTLAQHDVRDVLGGKWKPESERSQKLKDADASVEAKLKTGGVAPHAVKDGLTARKVASGPYGGA